MKAIPTEYEEIWLVSEDYRAYVLKSIPHKGADKYPVSGTSCERIQSAFRSARQARFEHGESPNI